MKKKLILMFALVAIALLFTLSIGAISQKPDLGVSFGKTQTIDGIVPPSQNYVGTTERVLLYDGEEYVTYPTYYITSNSTTFEMTFSAINNATGKNYGKTSVVMVEAPTGITHFKLWTFSGYTNVLYCKVPGTVVSYGNGNGWSGAFAECSSIRMIEFADGETPLDSKMFGSQMFTNSKALEYVKLPNNLRSAGGQMFEKCSSLKTVIFGASFETLADSAVNFEYTSNANISHKELYISANFGGEGVTLNNNMFIYNSTATKDESPKMIFYYTGTKSQAEALQAKALTTTNNGKLAYATIVSIDDFVRAEADATKNYIVYGYNLCDAFYDGVHSASQISPCVIECSVCNDKIVNHISEYEELVVEYANGFTAKGQKAVVCTSEGCGYAEISEMPALFENKGYSAAEYEGGGMSIGFKVDKKAIEKYEEITGETVNYGVFAVLADVIKTNDIFDADGKALDGVIAADITDTDFDIFNLKIVGFTGDQVDKDLVMGAYVGVSKDGTTEYAYLQDVTNEKNDKYYFASYNDVKAILDAKNGVSAQ